MKAVAILVLMGVAVASAYDWETDAAPKPKPKPCCTPDQWEGGIGSKGGVLARHHPMGVASYVKLSYDFKNGRIAMNEMMRFGCKKRSDKVILNFKNKAMYFIVGKKCYKKTLNKPMRKMCVPANSTYVGSFTFGLKPNSLALDTWKFGIKSRHARVGMDFTIAKGCIPVTESVEGVKFSRKGHTFFSMNSGYINISGGIKDAKVFIPPKSCTSYEKEFEEPEEVDMKFHGFSEDMEHAYKRFAELF